MAAGTSGLYLCIIFRVLCGELAASVHALELTLDSGLVSDLARDIMRIHGKLAEDLGGHRYHLEIYNLTLKPRPDFLGEWCHHHQFLCDDHQLDTIWTGIIDLSESRRLFGYQTINVSDVFIMTQYRGSHYVGCNLSVGTLNDSQIQNSSSGYDLHKVPRQLMDDCGQKLYIAIGLPGDSAADTTHENVNLSVEIVANYMPLDEIDSPSSNGFIEEFRNALQHQNRSNSSSASAETMQRQNTVSYSVSPVSKRLEEERVKIKKWQSARRSCGHVTESLNVSQLIPLFEDSPARHESVIPLQPVIDFQQCQGHCSGITYLPNGKQQYPLSQQQQHKEFYLTRLKLRYTNILAQLPTASCIGYNYKPFPVSFMYLNVDPKTHYTAALHQEYILSPSECACV